MCKALNHQFIISLKVIGQFHLFRDGMMDVDPKGKSKFP